MARHSAERAEAAQLPRATAQSLSILGNGPLTPDRKRQFRHRSKNQELQPSECAAKRVSMPKSAVTSVFIPAPAETAIRPTALMSTILSPFGPTERLADQLG